VDTTRMADLDEVIDQSTLAEAIVSPSFFLRAPEKTPRTVWRCQPVATSSIVAPSGRRSMAVTSSCLRQSHSNVDNLVALLGAAEHGIAQRKPRGVRSAHCLPSRGPLAAADNPTQRLHASKWHPFGTLLMAVSMLRAR